MSDPVLGIKDILESEGIATWKATSGWNITIGRLATTPETSVSIMSTGGVAPNPKFLLDYPSIQVLIRGSEQGYIAARDKAQAIKDVLLGMQSHDRGGDRWVQINMIGDLNTLGYDEKNRPMFSLNFQLIVLPATNPNTNRIPL